ncbi:MAG: MucB/RseB C-terminal domain-containing protein [Gammaproteobacteria bacterium]|nr:MucB/RseB C-terminal domain-containing protein [Gammaproteobacteria bacterium]
MLSNRPLLNATACVALGGLVSFAVPSQAQDESPNDWLNKMARAVQTTNYEGTVIRIKDGTAEALKVVRVVSDGVIREKVLVQEGNGLEIVRHGNEVHCILPDKKSVLVEEWDEQSGLFSTLPSSDVRFGSEYDLRIVRKERVAGRKAIMLAVQPHDQYRFGHRIWLDVETGFPLQTQLIGGDGAAVEQVKFADITLDRDIQLSALQPSYDTAGFRWIREPRRKVTRAVESGWDSDGLPPGFRVVSSHEEELPGSDKPTTHILFSDGLANVSVFVEPGRGEYVSERSRVGASNSFSIATGGYLITAVGEVPAETVEQIATSMQSR